MMKLTLNANWPPCKYNVAIISQPYNLSDNICTQFAPLDYNENIFMKYFVYYYIKHMCVLYNYIYCYSIYLFFSK